MPVYKKRVSTRDPRFKGRENILSAINHELRQCETTVIPVPDNVVLCNSCNQNIYSAIEETFGWLIYLGKRELKADRPYDFYCDDCTKRSWPKAIEVN